ncbi:hypothetical protein [Eubacterium aggregans]|uniref:hypothetical protein n=1 Tax=Eubacterium aggregans TaxID=81409 RepID=UPI003F3D9B84
MKHRYATSKNSLFLMELIIAIFFFVLASGVCIQIFVKAHVLSTDTQRTQLAVNESSSAADIIRANPGDATATLLQNLPGATLFEGAVECSYDVQGQTCAPADADIQMRILLSQAEGMITGEIVVTQTATQESLYTLQVKRYIPISERGGTAP